MIYFAMGMFTVKVGRSGHEESSLTWDPAET